MQKKVRSDAKIIYNLKTQNCVDFALYSLGLENVENKKKIIIEALEWLLW